MDGIDKSSPKILGLDVSTKTIGVALFDVLSGELLELTHVSPIIKIKPDTKIEELLLKSAIFAEKLKQYSKLNIEEVIIEEPLLNSNNINTVGTLMRFNTLVCKEVYDILSIVPKFVSTYNARKSAFPELVKDNGKGKEVLFGGLPKDVDKKQLIWELVSKREPQVIWLYNKNNVLKKENYDMSDAYCAVLGYMKSINIW